MATVECPESRYDLLSLVFDDRLAAIAGRCDHIYSARLSSSLSNSYLFVFVQTKQNPEDNKQKITS